MNGRIIHHCGVKVLDGTETYAIVSSQLKITTNTPIATSAKNSSLITHGVAGNAGVNNSYWEIQNNTIWVGGTVVGSMGWTTGTEAQTWFAQQYNSGNPVVVVYPLAEPTTETVTAQALTIQAGTNIITAEGSIDNLPLEVSYKAGVAVTITEVQNAQLDNNVEVIVNG